jgi:predicted enzyme related to lactoylglutathione lyase
MPTGPRPIGAFSWINVLTPDSDAARQFFTTVFGWEFMEIPGMGHIAKVDGHDIGGFWDTAHPNSPPGLPPGIGTMVRVDSAAAIADRAIALGGRSTPARPIGPSGTMAEVWDPTGAQMDVWESGTSPGATADPMRHGVPSWIECMTTDVAPAAAFYAELFGWTPRTVPMPEMEYTIFSNQEAMVAGMMALPPEMAGVPPHWGTYITVDDVDVAVHEATIHGGSVTYPAMDVPGTGRMAGIVSPQGVMFSVITYETA